MSLPIHNLFTQPPKEDQAGSAHTAKGACPPHPTKGGRVWPEVLDGILWTMTEHRLASLLEAVYVCVCALACVVCVCVCVCVCVWKRGRGGGGVVLSSSQSSLAATPRGY